MYKLQSILIRINLCRKEFFMSKKIIFMGTPHFAVPILSSLIESTYEVVLVVTQPDRPKGRRQELTPPPVKEVALKHNIPVFQPENIRNEYEQILETEADLIVTAAYGQLIPTEILDYPPHGCINVHASILPELRGGAPIHYALLQGKKETGITIMFMEETLDTGDIISQQRISIEEDDHVGTLHDKLAEVGANLLLETLPQLFSRTFKRAKQDDSKATYAPNITREQEKIDWTKNAEAIYNHIRGLHPWPVAYTIHEGKRMKVWWAEKNDATYNGKRPGKIVACNDDSFTVVCGNNESIRITDIQVAGKKRMKVSEFFRGNKDEIKVGQRLQ